MIIPVVITVFSDRSFTFITKTPPASVLIKRELGLKIGKKPASGSSRPNKDKVGKITKAQLQKLAAEKIQDTNAGSIDAAVRSLAGTARSMGVDVVD
jgi:large subunit ribosomal protein L11